MDGWMDKKNGKKLMDGGWIEKNEKIDGWYGQKKYMKKWMVGWIKNRWMVGWIKKI